MRLALRVEYLGRKFQGWQCQQSGLGIQDAVEEAISKVANQPTKTIASGRTDSGVHALGQILHFNTEAVRSNHQWCMGINHHLPNDISVQWVKEVSDSFHARFSAQQRRYVYLLYSGSAPSSLRQAHVLRVHQPLSISAMQKGAKYLLGEHDYSAFRSSQCQSKTPFRKVSHLHVYALGETIVVDIAANAFLHHMVRNIVGSLLTVGKDEKKPEWIRSVLWSKNRKLASEKVKSNGLYLLEVLYPEHHDLPKPDLLFMGWDFRHFALSHDKLNAFVLSSEDDLPNI